MKSLAENSVMLDITIFLFLAIDPVKESYLSDLVTPLQQACWDFLLKKFEGGPEVKSLDVCSICEVYNLKLTAVIFVKDILADVL